jgi:tRNA nucleotidyltransferase (CCA-adding enzyme)
VRSYLNQLKPGILKTVREAGTLSHDFGFRAFVAGGCVRDLILGRDVEDLDIVVNGDAILVAKKFASMHHGKLVVYHQFRTATVTLPDERVVDFASVRKEDYPHPGALPVVSPGSLEEDLFRRDFTINAMAIAIDPGHFGSLLDHYGGLNDLKRKFIRVLHDKSFLDDPTRILRAVRFEQRFQFAIEPVTLRLLRQAMKRGAVNSVKPPRFFEEFKKNLKEPAAPRNIQRLSRLGVLKFLGQRVRSSENKSRFIRQAALSLLWAKKNLPDSSGLNGWLVFWMVLCDGVSLAAAIKDMEKFSFTHADKMKTISVLSSANVVERLAAKRLSDSEAFAILRAGSNEGLLFFWSKALKSLARERIQEYFLKWRHLNLKVNGDDLKRLGIPSGKMFKNILDQVLYRVVEGNCRLKSEQLAYARSLYQQSHT